MTGGGCAVEGNGRANPLSNMLKGVTDPLMQVSVAVAARHLTASCIQDGLDYSQSQQTPAGPSSAALPLQSNAQVSNGQSIIQLIREV